MYAIKDDAIVQVATKDVIIFGAVQDPRIVKIETIVANHFNTTIHELNTFYRDTDAKIMCCFMLHDLFTYSISSLACRYNIDSKFLSKNITQTYIDCLSEKADMRRVIALRSAFFNNKTLEPVTH